MEPQGNLGVRGPLRDLSPLNCLAELFERCASKWSHTIQPFEECRTKAEDVSSLRNRSRLELLGRHVRGGSEECACSREIGGGVCSTHRARSFDLLVCWGSGLGTRREHKRTRQSEVRNARPPPLIDKHVIRLEITVNEPRGVRFGQPFT